MFDNNLGGVHFGRQKAALLDCAINHSIVIATIGRLLALSGEISSSELSRGQRNTEQSHVDRQPAIDVSMVKIMVLDEADCMLGAGFSSDMRTLGSMMKRSALLMLSATWPEEMSISSVIWPDLPPKPITVVKVDESLPKNKFSIPSSIRQDVEVLQGDGKVKKWPVRIQRLREILSTLNSSENAIVFVLHKSETKLVSRALNQGIVIEKGKEDKINEILLDDSSDEELSESSTRFAAALHGDMSTTARTAALESFRNGLSKALVCTDVACRGLDIDNVSLVVNMSIGLSMSNYVHRCGRTGRAGKPGRVHTFLMKGEEHYAQEIVSLLEEANQDVPSSLYALALNQNTSHKPKFKQKSNKMVENEDDDGRVAQQMENREKQRLMHQKRKEKERMQSKKKSLSKSKK